MVNTFQSFLHRVMGADLINGSSGYQRQCRAGYRENDV